MSVFRMPSLGADMEEGTLVEWLKTPGDAITRGDVIAVVETQKGAIEVEVFENGRIAEILVQAGATVPVGTPMARLEGADGQSKAERIAEPAPESTPMVLPATAPEPASELVREPQPLPRAAVPASVRASPAARRLAQARGISLEGISGTGPENSVTSGDVMKTLEGMKSERPSAPRGGVDLSQMRKAIGAAMSRSKREIPHYYLAHKLDLEPALAWLARANADRAPNERLLMAAVYLKALAKALGKFPEYNGFFEGGGFRRADRVHVGMAIALRGGGLVAPAIHDTDQLDIEAIMAKLRQVTARVRDGRLRSSELTDPTITLTSLGDRGVEQLFGVIMPPQVAIVGLGRPSREAWAIEDRIEPRTILHASLAADHRASDGHRGALFLAELDKQLANPEAL